MIQSMIKHCIELLLTSPFSSPPATSKTNTDLIEEMGRADEKFVDDHKTKSLHES